ncbi:TIGR04219 family outer membrane beta-barrel protein [Alteromonas sp. ASW11-36]|uniref:TIGR04219 family outer membrane beta-barrel protein n=1 Tax=Alteromonas arenosi TaxID=3055817 RepID=A0ABT7SZ04_9ALTE|nr:TIGR04219 family outer membrane beta-barrel protein [Alteromonas sp. ASW11-36]MDM7861431.1 TIGR04219 family outer membrane beta-barrel protein [Alteromonas sp. ASW11-36]
MRLFKIAALALCTSATFNAHADTVLGIYAGAQGWDMSTSGGFSDESNVTQFGFDSETNSSFYAALEHPIPLIPNLKVINTTMDTSGNTVLTSSFTFDGELFTADTDVFTDVQLTTTDFILYYEIFDNDLVSIDLGVNGKYVDGSLLVSDSASSLTAEQAFTGIVPMGYSRVAFGLPFTGLGVYAEGSYLSFDDNTVSDFQVALTYSFIESLALDMTLQVGYRDTTVELEDLDDIYTDLSFDGAFAGIEFHF